MPGPRARGDYAVEGLLESPKPTLELGTVVIVPVGSLLLEGRPVLVTGVTIAGFACVNGPKKPMRPQALSSLYALAKQGTDALTLRGVHAVFQCEDGEPGTLADDSKALKVREEVVLEVIQCSVILVHQLANVGFRS